MGCSSRTSTRVTRLPLTHSLVRCSSKEEEEKQIAAKVTDEFIDSLEELRKEEKIENFVLAGHSLGGYLVGKYALKYPKEVKGLILISPVGIPEQPAKEDRVDGNDLNWRLRFIQKLWQLGMTPQSLVRVIGSRGQDLVQNFITKRFSNRWEGEESKLISDYFYHITASPGNGEYCLNALLEPIFVKNRLKSNRSPVSANHKNKGEGGKEGEEEDEEEDKLNESRNGFRSGVFAKNPLEKELAHATFPILLIYGDHDWLYYPGASDSIAHWRKHGVRSDLAIVPRAGHHLYLDNSTDFNQLILDWTHGIRY
jgi:cardiolipin-specific phospholipase